MVPAKLTGCCDIWLCVGIPPANEPMFCCCGCGCCWASWLGTGAEKLAMGCCGIWFRLFWAIMALEWGICPESADTIWLAPMSVVCGTETGTCCKRAPAATTVA
uniref:Kunitz-type protease inhibitor 1-like n=1 Tax=Phallusia mammillata TaxID=59560 RepID=A0A6F9DU44_9ASCI|nr:kunitz-type protease inhibitor 1-like [Phallusia mammillata]